MFGNGTRNLCRIFRMSTLNVSSSSQNRSKTPASATHTCFCRLLIMLRASPGAPRAPRLSPAPACRAQEVAWMRPNGRDWRETGMGVHVILETCPKKAGYGDSSLVWRYILNWTRCKDRCILGKSFTATIPACSLLRQCIGLHAIGSQFKVLQVSALSM